MYSLHTKKSQKFRGKKKKKTSLSTHTQQPKSFKSVLPLVGKSTLLPPRHHPTSHEPLRRRLFRSQRQGPRGLPGEEANSWKARAQGFIPSKPDGKKIWETHSLAFLRSKTSHGALTHFMKFLKSWRIDILKERTLHPMVWSVLSTEWQISDFPSFGTY